MQSLDARTRDCLVAVVNNDADLHRFSRERWYRIPARSVGRSLAGEAIEESRILAIYQTAGVNAGLPGAIELWGEIEERLLLPRRAIVPEEPDHPGAGETYHLIRLRTVECLEAPIISHRPRRITFLRTTSSHLFHASSINDLIVGTPAEERLWRALKEEKDLELERKYFMRMRDVVMEVDFALLGRERSLGIICEEDASTMTAGNDDIPEAWNILRFSPTRLDAGFAECMWEIAREIRSMKDEV